MRKEPRFLDGVTDVTAKLNHVPLSSGTSIDEDLAFTLRQKAVDELERCGLAGTAAAQQHQRFTMMDRKIEIRDKCAVTVYTVRNVDEFNGRRWRVVHRQRKA
jgi:hypothetical protein